MDSTNSHIQPESDHPALAPNLHSTTSQVILSHQPPEQTSAQHLGNVHVNQLPFEMMMAMNSASGAHSLIMGSDAAGSIGNSLLTSLTKSNAYTSAPGASLPQSLPNLFPQPISSGNQAIGNNLGLEGGVNDDLDDDDGMDDMGAASAMSAMSGLSSGSVGGTGSNVCPPGNEHTGRWTRQEHELFLEALRLYGKEWKKVAAMVKTRTVVQTRTHAQKYFQKFAKAAGGGAGGGNGGGDVMMGMDYMDANHPANLSMNTSDADGSMDMDGEYDQLQQQQQQLMQQHMSGLPLSHAPMGSSEFAASGSIPVTSSINTPGSHKRPISSNSTGKSGQRNNSGGVTASGNRQPRPTMRVPLEDGPNATNMYSSSPIGFGQHESGGVGGMHINVSSANSHNNSSAAYLDLLNSPTGTTKKTAQILFSMTNESRSGNLNLADDTDTSMHAHQSLGNGGMAQGFAVDQMVSSSGANSGANGVATSGYGNMGVVGVGLGGMGAEMGFGLTPQHLQQLQQQQQQFQQQQHFFQRQAQLQQQQQHAGIPPLHIPLTGISNSIAAVPPPILPHDLPRPSPAACGKRKHAELSVAQALALGVMKPSTATAISSSSQSSESTLQRHTALLNNSNSSVLTNPSVVEGRESPFGNKRHVDSFSSPSASHISEEHGSHLKRVNYEDNVVASGGGKGRGLSIHNPSDINKMGLTLMNPPTPSSASSSYSMLGGVGNNSAGFRPPTPSTPWDKELRHQHQLLLEEQQQGKHIQQLLQRSTNASASTTDISGAASLLSDTDEKHSHEKHSTDKGKSKSNKGLTVENAISGTVINDEIMNVSESTDNSTRSTSLPKNYFASSGAKLIDIPTSGLYDYLLGVFDNLLEQQNIQSHQSQHLHSTKIAQNRASNTPNSRQYQRELPSSPVVYGNGTYSQSVIESIAALSKDEHNLQPTSAHSSSSSSAMDPTSFVKNSSILAPFSPTPKSKGAFFPNSSQSQPSSGSKTLSMLVRSNSSTSNSGYYQPKQVTVSYTNNSEELQLLYTVLHLIIRSAIETGGTASSSNVKPIEEFFLWFISRGIHSHQQSSSSIHEVIETKHNELEDRDNERSEVDKEIEKANRNTLARILNSLFPEGHSLLHLICCGLRLDRLLSPALASSVDNKAIDRNAFDELFDEDYQKRVASLTHSLYHSDYLYAIVKLLLSFGASVNIVDVAFNSVLHCCGVSSLTSIVSVPEVAVSTNSNNADNVVKLLTPSKPINVGGSSSSNSGTPSTITGANSTGMLFEQIGKLLLTNGCALNAVNSQGDTALHIASKLGHIRFIELLIQYGINGHIHNKSGFCALDVAADLLQLPAASQLSSTDAKPSEEQRSLDGNYYRSQIRRVIMTLDQRQRTLVLYHEDCLERVDPAQSQQLVRRATDWEGPDRLTNIMNKLTSLIQTTQSQPNSIVQQVLNDSGSSSGASDGASNSYIKGSAGFCDYEVDVSNRFEKATVELLQRVHSIAYIQLVDDLSKQFHSKCDASESSSSACHTSSSDPNSSSLAAIPGPPVLSVPFTPQVQRTLLKKPSDQLKRSENCDTCFTAGTLSASRRAAGAVAHAVDYILSGRNRNALCIVRPPGHHAGYEGLLASASSCGFCIFNSVCAGALHALEAHRCERVAIIDLDIHHGNGTEDIVRRYSDPSRLFFFSLHLYDKADTHQFFPGSGSSNDMLHNIMNVPLTPLWNAAGEPNRLAGRKQYLDVINNRLLPALRAFNPSLILLSMGFDAAEGDVGNRRPAHYPPLPSPTTTAAASATNVSLSPTVVLATAPTGGDGSTAAISKEDYVTMGMDLKKEDFEYVTSAVLKVADICCNGRVVSVLEGGYGSYSNSNTLSSSGNGKPTRATTRAASKSTASTAGNSSNATSKTTPAAAQQPVQPQQESLMNRDVLVSATMAHVRKLIDPYGL